MTAERLEPHIFNHDPDSVSFRDSLRRFSWQTDREESPHIYAQLSFLAYYLNCPCLDTEWLLSTLFDASLLSTLKPPETAALFLVLVSSFGAARDRSIALETINTSLILRRWTLTHARVMICSS
jgi:hypothetical protein